MESGTGLDDTGTEEFSFERKTADFFSLKKSALRSYSMPYGHIAITFGGRAKKKKEPLEGESEVVDGELDANGQHDAPERRRVVIL